MNWKNQTNLLGNARRRQFKDFLAEFFLYRIKVIITMLAMKRDYKKSFVTSTPMQLHSPLV
jgi:hypothetical protein